MNEIKSIEIVTRRINRGRGTTGKIRGEVGSSQRRVERREKGEKRC